MNRLKNIFNLVIVMRLVGMALSNLKQNKMRSLLTSLGIIIGIGAVITTFSASEGLKLSVQEQIKTLGSTSIFFSDYRSGFDKEDIRLLKKYNPKLKSIEGIFQGSGEFVARGKQEKGNVIGGSITYLEYSDFNLLQGRNFNKKEVDGADRVVVIGYKIYEELFNGGYAIGEKIAVTTSGSTNYFLVVGILEEKGESRNSPDKNIFIPDRTYTTYIDKNPRLEISAKALSDLDVELAQAISFTVLKPQKSRYFSVRTALDMVKFGLTISSKFTIIGYSLSIICLLVGGIGLMNIMLAAVAERRREIGIKRSIGFTTNLILMQFLVESLFICIIGGAIGFGFGVLGGHAMSSVTNAPAVISLKVALVGIFFSTLIGIGFGFFPSRKASKLDPVEALR